MTIQFNYNNAIGTIEVIDVGVWVSHESLHSRLHVIWLRGALRTVVESMLRAHGVAI